MAALMQAHTGETSELKVLVCYDQPQDNFVPDIKNAGWDYIKPEPFTGEELSDALKHVNALKNAAVRGGGLGEIKTAFDGFDIVMLDNNLTALDAFEGVINTAEPIIGFIRTFSNSPYIVSVNRMLDVDFDLGSLVGDRTTAADLALNHDHLSNLALWTHDARDAAATGGFLPWYWPQLASVSVRRCEQIEFVLRHMNDPVLDALKFDDDARSALSMRALGFLTHDVDGEPRSASEATFSDVYLTSGRALASLDERKKILGLAEGCTTFRHAVARTAAAAVDLWLRADVLAAQNALIDIPHLLGNMPFLLGQNVHEIALWNGEAVAIDSEPPHGLDRDLFVNLLRPAEFIDRCWVPSPCFWWTTFESSDALTELFVEAHHEVPDFVFCEDRSIFVEKGDGTTVREFKADLDGAWNQRFVSRLADMSYDPASRLAS